ncbi:MAG TPA: ATP-grasp domain-containing protein [Vicinamibacterales bacterium]
MRVLIFSTTTGYQLRSFGDAAEALGVELAFATDRCKSLDNPWQDHAVPVRFYDEEGSLARLREAAAERPVNGVVVVGDRAVRLAACAAEMLGLPGNPPDAAWASANKKASRERFAAAGLPVPWFVELPEHDNDDVLAQVRFPCVVKPLGLSGSRGVIRANDRAELDAAIARVRALLARKDIRTMRTGLDQTMLIEGYIDGAEFAIEGVLTAGRFQPFAIFDKPDPLDGPFFEETIYVTPSSLSAAEQRDVIAHVERAARALGLTHGSIHAECRVARDGIYVLEVAARPIGGLCSRVLRFERRGDGEAEASPYDVIRRATLQGRHHGEAKASLYASLEEVLLRHAVGEDVTPFAREAQAAAVMMIPIPKRGILKRVEGTDAARAVPGIEDVRITAKPDQLLEPLPEAGSYLGFIFARAATPGEGVAALRAAHGALRFVIDVPIPIVSA